MEIHNTMEDIVIQYLDEILALKKNICKCKNCRMDMACYALNKIKPMYVASARGIIHIENKKRRYIQEEIDIYAIVAEGIDVVSNIKRHNEKIDANDELQNFIGNYNSEGIYFYNFPLIIGRIFDSLSLKPVDEAIVSLYSETSKNIASMFNNRWLNPIKLVPQMNGTFSFWVTSIQAEKQNMQKDFYFNLAVEKEEYDTAKRYFYVRIISNDFIKKQISKKDIYYLDDIYLTPIES